MTTHVPAPDGQPCGGFEAIHNAPCWLHIPAYDVARARQFYAAALGFQFREANTAAGEEPGKVVHIHFPGPFAQSFGGGILRREPPPGETELKQPPLPERGTGVVYFWAEDLDAAMAKVEAAGGKCMKPSEGGGGWHCDFRDTEGNFHGFYTMNAPKEG